MAIVGHLGAAAKDDSAGNKDEGEGEIDDAERTSPPQKHQRRDTIMIIREKQHAQHERIEAELLHTHDRSTPTPDDAEHKKQEQAPTTTKATNKQKGKQQIKFRRVARCQQKQIARLELRIRDLPWRPFWP